MEDGRLHQLPPYLDPLEDDLVRVRVRVRVRARVRIRIKIRFRVRVRVRVRLRVRFDPLEDGPVRGQVDPGGEGGGGAEHEQLPLQVGRLDHRLVRVRVRGRVRARVSSCLCR